MRRKPALHSGQMTSPFLMQQLCTPVITVPRRLPWLELKLIGLRRLKRLVPVVVRRRHSLEVHGDDMRRCDQLRRVLFIGGPQMRAHQRALPVAIAIIGWAKCGSRTPA